MDAPIMTARDMEQATLDRCVDCALGNVRMAGSRAEASAFRYAAMSLQITHPVAAQRLWQASEAYFVDQSDGPQTPAELVHQGHILSLTRFRDMLYTQLEHQVPD